MTDAKFTPGPWVYERDFNYWNIEPTGVAGKDNREGNEADYHLIAAAPDLYHACQLVLKRLAELPEHARDDTAGARMVLSVALAKARGETP